jgi:hypothetical protein
MRPHKIDLLLVAAALVGCAKSTQQAATTPAEPMVQVPPPQVSPAPSVIPGSMIGVVPTWLPEEIQNAEPVRTLFDSLIAVRLRLAGYVVVPVPEFEATLEAQRREHGAFDPATGQPDSAKMVIAGEHAFQALQESYHVTAWLKPEIVIVPAKVELNTAAWDGTTQGIASAWDWLGGNLFEGTLPALSLCVRIADTSGMMTYHQHGGIEVASRRANKPVPREKLFRDMKRNQEAVRKAIQPYLDQARREAPVT